MDPEITAIEIIIGKYLNHCASVDELEALDRWVTGSPAHAEELEKTRRAWNHCVVNFTKEQVEEDRIRVNTRIDELYLMHGKRTRILWFIGRVAALALLLTGICWVLNSHQRKIQKNEMVCRIFAPAGQVKNWVLPDGTQVCLNSGSAIRYEASLSGKYRKVSLDGEAYFKVTKNKARPFIVTTPEMDVKVLGTSFDVKAYSDEEEVEATLDEGSIALHLNRSDRWPARLLKPHERAVYDRSQQKLQIATEPDTYLYTSWRDGKYFFRDATLETIFLRIEKMYNVRIHLTNNEAKRIRMRATFDRRDSLPVVLRTIEQSTSLTYYIRGKDIWFK